MSRLVDAVKELSRSDVLITPDFLDGMSNSRFADVSKVSAIKKANKLISQLMARSWLENNRDLFNRQAIAKILVDTNNIDDPNELDSIIDSNPYTPDLWGRWTSKPTPPPPPAKNFVGYWQYSENPVILHLYTPFPNRPEQVTDTQLNEWIDDTDEELQVPNIIWIPATC